VIARFAGVALFAAVAIGFWPILRESWRAQEQIYELSVEPVPGGRFAVRARLEPPGLGKRTHFLVDRSPVEAEFGGDGRLETTLGPFSAGMHSVCLQARYGGFRVREVCRAVLVGPLEPAASPARRAVRILIAERMLSDLEGIAARRLHEAVAEKVPFVKVRGAKVKLSLEEKGVRARGKVTLKDGSAARASVLVGARFSGAKVTLQRLGRTKVSAGGPTVKQISDLGAALGGALGELLGDAKGKEIGSAIGKALVGVALDAILKWAVERVLDREVLPALAEALTLPEAVDLGPEWGAARLSVRYAGEPRFEPGRGIHLALDLGLSGGAPSAAMPRAAAPRPSPGWLRRPGEPPAAPRADVVVDVSPDVANMLLHGLWAQGRLRALANEPSRLAEWDGRLADLVVRPAAVDFDLPPLVQPVAEKEDAFELAVGEVALRLVPRTTETGAPQTPVPLDARLLVRLGLDLSFDAAGRTFQVQGRLREVGLACLVEADPGVRRPCFDDALRIAREELGRPDTALLDLLRLPLDRLNPLAATKASANEGVVMQIPRVEPSIAGGWIRLTMQARFSEVRRN
jgi:hypothetical protein